MPSHSFAWKVRFAKTLTLQTGFGFSSTHEGAESGVGGGEGRGLGGLGDARGRQGALGKVGGEEAERLALVGGKRRTVALEVAWDAAAGGA